MRRFFYLTVIILSLSCYASMAQTENKVIGSGLAKTTKLSNTNSITEREMEEYEGTSYNNIIEYMRAKVPGLSIGAFDGNTMPSIKVRGVSSMNASTDPLFLVDGMESTNILNISPMDVHKVNVYKDASAVIYGFRGANGVIEIITKSKYEAEKQRDAMLKAEKKAKKEAKKKRK